MPDNLDRPIGGATTDQGAIASLAEDLIPTGTPESLGMPGDMPPDDFGKGLLAGPYGSVAQPIAELADEPANPVKEGPAKIALKQIVLDPGPWFWHLLSMWADAHQDTLKAASINTAQGVANLYLQEVLIGHARMFQQWQASGQLKEDDWQYDFRRGLMDPIDELMRVASMSHSKKLINQGVRQTLQRLSGVFPDGKIPPEIEELAWLGEEH